MHFSGLLGLLRAVGSLHEGGLQPGPRTTAERLCLLELDEHMRESLLSKVEEAARDPPAKPTPTNSANDATAVCAAAVALFYPTVETQFQSARAPEELRDAAANAVPYIDGEDASGNSGAISAVQLALQHLAVIKSLSIRPAELGAAQGAACRPKDDDEWVTPTLVRALHAVALLVAKEQHNPGHTTAVVKVLFPLLMRSALVQLLEVHDDLDAEVLPHPVFGTLIALGLAACSISLCTVWVANEEGMMFSEQRALAREFITCSWAELVSFCEYQSMLKGSSKLTCTTCQLIRQVPYIAGFTAWEV